MKSISSHTKLERVALLQQQVGQREESASGHHFYFFLIFLFFQKTKIMRKNRAIVLLVTWIKYKILSNFDLLKSLVAPPEAEIPPHQEV